MHTSHNTRKRTFLNICINVSTLRINVQLRIAPISVVEGKKSETHECSQRQTPDSNSRQQVEILEVRRRIPNDLFLVHEYFMLITGIRGEARYIEDEELMQNVKLSLRRKVKFLVP